MKRLLLLASALFVIAVTQIGCLSLGLGGCGCGNQKIEVRGCDCRHEGNEGSEKK